MQVIKKLGMRPEGGVRATLVSEHRLAPYSGMLPGCIAGTYTEEDIHIHLERLCRWANVRFIHASVAGLDLEARQVNLQGRAPLAFDVLSVNTGAKPKSPHAQAITVKPIADFLPKWRSLKESLMPGDRVLIAGAGAGGVELALAVRAVVPADVEVVMAGRTLLKGHSQVLCDQTLEALRNKQIQYVSQNAQPEADGSVVLEGWAPFPVERVLWVTQVEAPAWYADAGLAVDERGFVRVNQHLQSVSHPDVFGAGDVVHLEGQTRAKSGVYAVRAGPVLAENLRRQLTGAPLKTFKAQSNHLALIGLGDHTALASRGAQAWGPNKALWRLKDRIDQRFMDNFNKLPPMDEKRSAKTSVAKALAPDVPDAEMRCGGCGAKLAADPLRRVLHRLPPQEHARLMLGAGDDAAQVTVESGSVLLSVDGFRDMVGDPYLLGRICAHHSLNDLFAMGATPVAGLALVTLPLMSDALMEEDLFQLLSGVVSVLNGEGAVLAGGHTAEGAELSIALTVTGEPGRVGPGQPSGALTKSGAQVGDYLLLTKPLGTGAVLAAAMRGQASAESTQRCIEGMDTSNAAAARVAADNAVHALTDVTGFGLLGHLGEMLRASAVGVKLGLEQIPLLPGAQAAVKQSPSSLQSSNELALQDYVLRDGLLPDNPHVRLLCDPQTSGGLLMSVAEHKLEAASAALSNAGVAWAAIGQVCESSCWEIHQRLNQEHGS